MSSLLFQKKTLLLVLFMSFLTVETVGAQTFTVVAVHGARYRSANTYSRYNQHLSDVQGAIPHDASVEVLSTQRVNGQTWSQVRIDGQTYWMNSHLLRDSSGHMPAITPASDETQKGGTKSAEQDPTPLPKNRPDQTPKDKASDNGKTKPQSEDVPMPKSRPKIASKSKTPPAKDKNNDKNEKPQCTGVSRKADTFARSALGGNIHLTRTLVSIPSLTQTVSGMEASGRVKTSGASLILGMTVGGMLNTDLPIWICKKGKSLYAELLTSKARMPGSKEAQDTIVGAVQQGKIPGVIKINIAKQKNQLILSSEDGQFKTTAAIR